MNKNQEDSKIVTFTKNAIKGLMFPLISVFVSLFIAVFFVMWSKGYSITEYFTALSDLIRIILKGSYGDYNKALTTIIYIAPLIFTGVANAIAFKCGLFNIGVEGQFTLGMIAAAIVGTITGLTSWIHVPLVILAGIVAGGLWGAIPGYLKAKFGTNEVINTIMMNYIAIYVVNIIILRTPFGIAKKATTPKIEESAKLLRFVKTNQANIGIIIAIVCAIFIFWLLWKTTIGYEIRAVGINPFGAEYGGINIAKKTILAMVLSGAVAGLGGAAQVSGVMYSCTDITGFIGYGFDGIAVALLAKSNPLGCIPAAILFGTLSSSSRILQLNGIPKEIVALIQSVVIIFVASDYIVKYFINKRKKKGAIVNG